MLSEKNYKQRTYLDPIHGPIQLNLSDPSENLLSQLVDLREFQRLRRIHQMGLAWFTFHGAEHTRFGHSLGTLFVVKKMLGHLSNNFPEINAYKTEILICALIHDIGHSPFSHTSEKFVNFTHEEWTKKIIQTSSEVNSLLAKYDKSLIDKILQIFKYEAIPSYLSQIISSYIDCDRLDYLHRDSYFVGVPYGLTGSDRIIASLEIDKSTNRLIVNENIGLDAVVHYLQARHSMYQQIYQHKKNLACDFLLRKIIQKVREIKPKSISQALASWINFENKPIEKIDNNLFLQVDDFLVISNIQNWASDLTTEKTLNDLSTCFINRKLFKSLEFRGEITSERTNEFLEKIKSISKSKGLDPDYYVGIEQSASKPYEPYQTSRGLPWQAPSKAIFIKQQNGQVQELSEISGLVKALSQENIVKTCLVFAPELEDEIMNIKGFHEIFK